MTSKWWLPPRVTERAMMLSPSPDVWIGEMDLANPSWAMAAILHSSALLKDALVNTIPIVVLRAVSAAGAS